MAAQVFRLLFCYESFRNAEKTGQFSWRTLDWVSWLKHPLSWSEGIRVALAFQRMTKSSSEEKEAMMQEVAERCKANQAFYEQLHQDVDRKLLLPGWGSIIVARTPEEKKALREMQDGLAKEGRDLIFLCGPEMEVRYGFTPKGIAFARKPHDAVLSPNFMKLLAQRVEDLGGKVINGTLKTIYADDIEHGGIIEYATPLKKNNYMSFSHLVVSLGNQRILGHDGQPLFDVVAARGVSALGVAYVLKGCKLPRVTVCGGTNHATTLSEPISIQGIDGLVYDCYLLRMTAAACITPNVLEEDSANYDGVAATGLISAVRQTLGCEVEIFSVYGCNRQLSEYGQSHWVAPSFEKASTKPYSILPRKPVQDLGTHRLSSPTIQIQMGAGGGGLTMGPAQPPRKEKHSITHQNERLNSQRE
jgi:hypothetical protein